jgi:hypothetical protein
VAGDDWKLVSIAKKGAGSKPAPSVGETQKPAFSQ